MDDWQRQIERRLNELEKDKAVDQRDKKYVDDRFNRLETQIRDVKSECHEGFASFNKKLQTAMYWALGLIGGTILLAFLNFALEGGLNVGS